MNLDAQELINQRLTSLKKQAEILEDRTELPYDLVAYTKKAWPIYMPGRPLIWNWHMDHVLEHLAAMANGQIPRLIICVPPRTGKSSLVNVMFPTWLWTQVPHTQLLTLSHSERLSTRDALFSRRLLTSDWYQERWGDKFFLTGDQNEKTRYQNDQHGHRISQSITSRVTGEGGDIIMIDDPLSADEAPSDAQRNTVNDAFDIMISTRLNNPISSSIVIIQQRLHEDDLVGHLLKDNYEGYEYLTIPMEYEGVTYSTSLGLTDPRKKKGELLMPDRFPREKVDALKKRLGGYAACTPGHTPILMSDWSEKEIKDIKVGDEVIGFTHGILKGTKGRLVPSKILNVYKYEDAEVERITTKSGRILECTPDHRWFRRMRKPGQPEYLPAAIGSPLIGVYKRSQEPTPEQQRWYDWLGGMLDGEGSCGRKRGVSISQSAANPDVQEAIDECLSVLEIEHYSRKAPRSRPEWADSGHWLLKGGRSLKMKLLKHCRMVKRKRFIESLWSTVDRVGENIKKTQDTNHRVCKIEQIENQTVYGLTTETGNYVAWGFASENSGQLQQNPTQEEGGILKRKYFRKWTKTNLPFFDTIIVSVDGAFTEADLMQGGKFKPKASQSACLVIGVYEEGGNTIPVLLESWADFLDFDELKDRVAETVDRSKKKGEYLQLVIEKKASGISLIQSLKKSFIQAYPFRPDTSKIARAYAAQPVLSSLGLYYLDNPGNVECIEQAAGFPNVKFKDLVDCLTMAMIRLSRMNVLRVPEDEVRMEEEMAEDEENWSREVVPQDSKELYFW
jgi:predicted phage terminase large subunit-like protein